MLTDRGVELPFTAEALASTPVAYSAWAKESASTTTGTGPALAITEVHFPPSE